MALAADSAAALRPARRSARRCSLAAGRARCLRPRAAKKDADGGGEEEAEMIQMDAEEKMEKSLDSVVRNFATVRTGRASTAILDRILVDYYGAPTAIKAMANASTPDSQTIVIQPFDKTTIKDIERALNQSDLGLTPGNDGNVIRLSIPQLTAERRKELTKVVGKLSEDGKIAVRNIRRDAVKDLEKLEKEGLSEDALAAAKEAVQKLTDKYVKAVEDEAAKKNKELTQL